MTLFTATLLTGLVLLAVGLWLAVTPTDSVKILLGLLRSQVATMVTMIPAIIWFSWEVMHLSEADFGNHKEKILIGFLVIGVSSLFTVKDFLAVRGAAILGLMISKLLLDAAFMQDPQTRLFLVSLVYLGIIAALYLGTVPFRMRDLLEWLKPRNSVTRGAGILSSAYGILLVIVAVTY